MTWAKGIALSLVAVFSPIGPMLGTVVALIFTDLGFGIWAAHKRGEKITSAALRRTISKIFVYEVVLCILFLSEKYLLNDIVPVTKLVAGVIGMVEMTSVLENVQCATGLDLKRVIRLLGSKNDSKKGE